MFSQVSVILLKRGFSCDHYPWCIGPHCTDPPAPGLALSTSSHGTSLCKDPLALGPSLDMAPHYTGPATSDIWWPSLETCSNLFISELRTLFCPTSTDILILLTHVWSAQPGGTHHTGKFSCFWSMFPLSSSTHTPENSNPSNFTKCHLDLWLWWITQK